MKWFDGNNIDIKDITGTKICEKLAEELWNYDYKQWLELDEVIQTAAFIIAFDTELQMEGIFTFLENSMGQYCHEIVDAFRAIGDENDAAIMSEICRLTSFKLNDEIAERIEELEKQLYLWTDFDMWQLLFNYLDAHISVL